MEIVSTVTSLPARSPIAFVPTMGALHEGHAALIRQAAALSTNVIVSIFVNPLQFENPADLKDYPRTPERDADVARRAGATTLWFPTMQDLYPNGYEKLAAPESGEIFEGAHRVGHFSGVLTAVNALFLAVKPRWAIFGEKDFQQLFLVRQLAQERHKSVEIIGAPTVRDEAGLALSSRNVRLSQAGRVAARVISKALRAAQSSVSLAQMNKVLAEVLATESGFTLDYCAIVDENSLALATEGTRQKRALVAGWVEGVRLIDNMAMTSVKE